MSRLRSLWWAQSGLCHLCGKPVPEPGSVWPHRPDAPTEDHVIPRASRAKGKSGYGNHLMAHRLCNAKRGCEEPTAKMIVLGEVVHAVRRARNRVEGIAEACE